MGTELVKVGWLGPVFRFDMERHGVVEAVPQGVDRDGIDNRGIKPLLQKRQEFGGLGQSSLPINSL